MITLSPEATILFVSSNVRSVVLVKRIGALAQVVSSTMLQRSVPSSILCRNFSFSSVKKRRSCFLTFFARISWTNLVWKKKKKCSTPLPCKQVSEERGWGVKRYPSTHLPTRSPLRFLDSNFIYSPLFLS